MQRGMAYTNQSKQDSQKSSSSTSNFSMALIVRKQAMSLHQSKLLSLNSFLMFKLTQADLKFMLSYVMPNAERCTYCSVS